MKASFFGEIAVHLLWPLLLLLQFASLTEGQAYTSVPQNVTMEAGKSVSFECGVSGLVEPNKIRFSVLGSKVNASVTCPGQKTLYLPAQSMRGHCETKSSTQVAVWDIAGAAKEDNGTIFLCQVNTLDDKIGYLYVIENGGYYAMLIGCVIGGFFAALIVISVAYILLKRSERVQQCFRSVGGAVDEPSAQTQTKEY